MLHCIKGINNSDNRQLEMINSWFWMSVEYVLLWAKVPLTGIHSTVNYYHNYGCGPALAGACGLNPPPLGEIQVNYGSPTMSDWYATGPICLDWPCSEQD